MIDAIAVASRMQIVKFRSGRHRFGYSHEQESAALNQRHGTHHEGSVKVIGIEHESLDTLDAAFRAASDIVRDKTGATIEKGMRLLPAGNQLALTAAVADSRAMAEASHADFLYVYPSLRTDAPRRLNGLYPTDARKAARVFPDIEKIAEKFTFSLDFLPCPTEGKWQEWIALSAEAAEQELRERLTAALERVVERCDSNGKLHETVFTSLAELLALVPDFNFSQCQQIQAARQAALGVSQSRAEDLRADKPARQRAADQARAALEMLSTL